MEDVDNHFEIIEHDPLARRKTVNGSGSNLVMFLYFRLNLVRDRFKLWFGSCRTDHEKVGEAGDAGEIENDNVFGLFVGGELGAGRG